MLEPVKLHSAIMLASFILLTSSVNAAVYAPQNGSGLSCLNAFEESSGKAILSCVTSLGTEVTFDRLASSGLGGTASVSPILISSLQPLPQSKNSIVYWPDNTVHYRFVDANEETQKVFHEAIKQFEENTRVRFIQLGANTTGVPYFEVMTLPQGSWCGVSPLGRVKHLRQPPLAVHAECVDKPTMLHLLMRVLGFPDQHQRADRDQYLSLSSDMIEKYPIRTDIDTRLPYDYRSVTHHKALEAKDPTKQELIGPQAHLSAGDIALINAVYYPRGVGALGYGQLVSREGGRCLTVRNKEISPRRHPLLAPDEQDVTVRPCRKQRPSTQLWALQQGTLKSKAYANLCLGRASWVRDEQVKEEDVSYSVTLQPCTNSARHWWIWGENELVNLESNQSFSPADFPIHRSLMQSVGLRGDGQAGVAAAPSNGEGARVHQSRYVWDWQ